MTLVEFIKANDVEYTCNRISSATLVEVETKLNMCFGTQLKNYILEYGYLGYKYIEFYGINNVQELNSDMVKKTLFLNQQFDKTKGLIVIECQGDGDYYLVDSKDMVYRFVAPNNDLIPQNIDLYEYILGRFLQSDEY